MVIEKTPTFRNIIIMTKYFNTIVVIILHEEGQDGEKNMEMQ